ncbi:hypothetical protein A3H53_01160 [Candidatus Nomurabacteria bacterium RIFCSPLOWO2_02_FULL_40_10]|uniref:NlpC/P60 domain-containing protein n=1 Tax=Candidatus Nomurabacteria bacterium RIFCSPLOWO2_02_FULL_40_10 TaxID=1801786 RepID=A0A1F6XWV8_9BACT|nr:MAG: hypothetical protein A3H53_01160 [Candidatus Nomurabacteria bacterium RIFCSPLOWO2_02_FULL_40_10]
MKPLIFRTYLTLVKNSVGSKSFSNFYVLDKGKKIDVTENGRLSCAWFVSAVLSLFGFIKTPHLTVKSVEEDLLKSGWYGIKKPKVGSVLSWEAVDFGKGEFHRHIGFYIGGGKAVSNSSKLGYPVVHHWRFVDAKNNKGRLVERILWHKKLDAR